MQKAVIFDFDGVIHDTFEFHRQKIKDFSGIDLTPKEFKDMHNGEFYASQDSRLKSIVWDDYKDFIYDDQVMLEIGPEVKAAMFELSKISPLYVVSAGSVKNLDNLFINNGIRELFKGIYGLEHSKSKQEKFQMLMERFFLNPEDCIFVTDTLGDLIDARGLGIRSIAVEFGYHDRKTLQKGSPISIVKDFPALVDEIKSHL